MESFCFQTTNQDVMVRYALTTHWCYFIETSPCPVCSFHTHRPNGGRLNLSVQELRCHVKHTVSSFCVFLKPRCWHETQRDLLFFRVHFLVCWTCVLGTGRWALARGCCRRRCRPPISPSSSPCPPASSRGFWLAPERLRSEKHSRDQVTMTTEAWLSWVWTTS